MRASHKPFDGLVLPIDNEFWREHYPPNGWRCRCIAFGIDERVRIAVDLLHARDLADPLALETLAAAVHISPNHLIRLFRKDLQTTPHQFWDRLRIEHAQSRLRQPDMRVKEVAIDLGFKHLSHFSKWFKRHTESTPQAARERGLGR